ncbi:transposase, partial [Stappia sp. TSB10P1A]|uniref:transposase n=1 Tax=Stappia sp. TSB10P1A TaxID=2003585 RepID=UPI001AD94715
MTHALPHARPPRPPARSSLSPRHSGRGRRPKIRNRRAGLASQKWRGFPGLGGLLMKQQRFTQEFRDEAVRLVVSVGRRQAEVSRELGIGLSTLERWVASA